MAKKKRKREPTMVPLSPAVLRASGVLPDGWPFVDEAFDPDKDWTQRYRLYGSHGYKGDKTAAPGTLEIHREKAIGGQRLKVTQRITHDDKREHLIRAEMSCAVDMTATPRKWRVESRFTGAGEPVAGVASTSEGAFRRDSIRLKAGGLEQKFNSRQLAADWSLMEAVQRLPYEEMVPLHFDMMEGLSLLRPGHVLTYGGTETYLDGGREVLLYRFSQVGRGILPYEYYLDENHRLVLSITLSRAYWLDREGGAG